MNFFKKHWLKLILFCFFLTIGIFLSNQNYITKTRFLFKGVKEKLELIYVLNYQAKEINEAKSTLFVPEFIAHAGGGFEGMKYLNCLECLENSKNQGFDFVEMDLSWTKDGELVALHGWGSEMIGLFGVEEGRRTLGEFKNLKMAGNLTQMDLDDVTLWLSENPEVYLITDIKDDNVKALEKIKNQHPEILGQIIPQIYFFKEYAPVVALGYKNIILTLYRADYHHNLVYDFAADKNLFAVTIPSNQLDYPGNLVERLDYLGVPILTHTVDDVQEWKQLKNMGVNGVYTNFLQP